MRSPVCHMRVCILAASNLVRWETGSVQFQMAKCLKITQTNVALYRSLHPFSTVK